MDIENAIRRAADHIGERDEYTADLIARAIEGEAGHIRPIALDFAWHAARLLDRQGHSVSRNEIRRILQDDTR